MIKENKTRPLFHPSFGSRPACIVGRDKEIDDFMMGLEMPIGSYERCTFFTGQRGMGKTALLQELADRAEEQNYVVALVTAYASMTDDIIETIQRNGAGFIPAEKKRIQGIEAGAFGFSFGLTFSEAAQTQLGFRSKLTLLCDRLAESGKGILILVDEAKTSDEMRQLAITYQHLVGEDKNIAIAMAGLPQAVSGVLNDKVLTFLNRAKKVHLGCINQNEIYAYYKKAFELLKIDYEDDIINKAVSATNGLPYMMQLIGYYMEKLTSDKKITGDVVEAAIKAATRDLERNVFEPILNPLSDNDYNFLCAMSKDTGDSKMSDIGKRLGKANAYLQPYRARLIDAGIRESKRTGEVTFAVPYLAEYLREKQDVQM